MGKLCSDKQIDPPDEEGHVRIVTIDGQGAVTEEGFVVGKARSRFLDLSLIFFFFFFFLIYQNSYWWRSHPRAPSP